MKSICVMLVVLVYASALYADDAVPPPREIQPALQKYDEAVKQADAAYRKAMIAAKTQLLEQVQAQLRVVMRAGNLQTTKSLAAMKSRLEGDIKWLSFTPVIIRAEATKFTKVMEVKKDQAYHFEARGMWSMNRGSPKWTCNADGVSGQNHTGALMARVNGKLILLGHEATIRIPEDGILELGPNDSGLQDNAGSLEVRIESAVSP